MTTPPLIDPRVLAAEIEATVNEFNRLAHLAPGTGVSVFAELHQQAMQNAPARPILMVQVAEP